MFLTVFFCKFALTNIKVFEMVIMVINFSVVHVTERLWASVMQVIMNHVVHNVSEQLSSTKSTENWPEKFSQSKSFEEPKYHWKVLE